MGAVYDFLRNYQQSHTLRLHMPGHKGRALIPELAQAAALDITEIAGADSLFEDEGILLASEQETAALYGSKETLYAAGGSTLCIQTMLACYLQPGDQVIAGRNAHLAFWNSCILLDLRPVWVLPQYHPGTNLSGEITAESIEQAILQNSNAKAVYLTTPDYLGCLSDVKAIAAVAHAHNLPLLVDNAHGAYLHFLAQPLHPIDLGADACTDSAHKTLPALTGAAYLHLSKDTGVTRQQAKQKMHLFGSTSPSYLTLLSLDVCADYMKGQLREDLSEMVSQIAKLKGQLAAKGGLLEMAHVEPGKITIDCAALGCSGGQLAKSMREFTPPIEPEYVSESEIVLMFAPGMPDEDYAILSRWIDSIQPKKPILRQAMPDFLPEAVLTPREAYFKQGEILPVEQVSGRIALENRIICPPGVPVVAAGERINKEFIKFLKKAGIFELNVI